MLIRVSPLTRTRCNPVLLGLKPRESVSNLGPPGQISYFDGMECKVRGSAVRALDLGPTSGKCQCVSRVSPLTPIRCNPVALGFKPQESVSNLGTTGQLRILIVWNAKIEGPPFKPSTSAQLAGIASVLVRVSPLTPTRFNPVKVLDLGPTIGWCQLALQDDPSNEY